jgi:hypothetical protein
VEDLNSSHGTYLIDKDIPESLIASTAGERCANGVKIKIRNGVALRFGAQVTRGSGK